jgi:hypothetical protein
MPPYSLGQCTDGSEQPSGTVVSPADAGSSDIQLQGDQKVFVHLMIAVQKKTRKNILEIFNHLP